LGFPLYENKSYSRSPLNFPRDLDSISLLRALYVCLTPSPFYSVRFLFFLNRPSFVILRRPRSSGFSHVSLAHPQLVKLVFLRGESPCLLSEIAAIVLPPLSFPYHFFSRSRYSSPFPTPCRRHSGPRLSLLLSLARSAFL